MGKKFSNVSDMIKGLVEDEKVKKGAIDEINKRSLAKFLFYLRCDNNLTQKQLSEKIGCTQSRISKIENSYNQDISVQDLLDYGNAMNLGLELGFRNKNARIVDLIDFHIYKIKECVDKLTSYAKGDESISKGVAGVISSISNQLFDIVQENIGKLEFVQKRKDKALKEEIHLSLPILNKRQKIREEAKA